MRAGDTLYLPRGWLHQAMTSDTPSLHLTVGIDVATWLDAVRAALDEAAKEEVDFGGAFPLTDGLRKGCSTRSPSGCGPRPSRRGRRARSSEAGAPVREDAFDQARALEEPRRRHAARAARDRDLRPRRRRATTRRSRYEGRELRFPARIAAELEFVRRRRRGRSGSPTCPGGSTRRGGSCSAAGSCARAFSGSARLTT